MTRTVSDELSQEYKQFIIQYIHENHKQLTDYLQIFDFYIEDEQQWLTQRQEEPKREKVVYVALKTSKPIQRKVWVMDQDDHVILLFPEDY